MHMPNERTMPLHWLHHKDPYLHKVPAERYVQLPKGLAILTFSANCL